MDGKSPNPSHSQGSGREGRGEIVTYLSPDFKIGKRALCSPIDRVIQSPTESFFYYFESLFLIDATFDLYTVRYYLVNAYVTHYMGHFSNEYFGVRL